MILNLKDNFADYNVISNYFLEIVSITSNHLAWNIHREHITTNDLSNRDLELPNYFI
jgi:hypothetical protein